MKKVILLLFICTFCSQITAQYIEGEPITDSLSTQKRKKQFIIGTASAYSLASVGLYFAWYDDYDQQSFHFFNDWNEWLNMDKLGHLYGSYIQSDLLFQLGQWSGYDDEKSLKIACLTALGFQTGIEVMDGFSSRWGFSVPDFTFNIMGIGSFYAQQKLWNEQRIRLKFSYWPVQYSDEIIHSETGLYSFALSQRSDALYGINFFENLVKDYNGQTIWISANLKSFWRDSRIPPWLNLAIGFGAENLYGGFENRWEINDENIIVSVDRYPRNHQYILSPDIDFSKIKTKSPFLKTLFDVLNMIKLPAPAIMINSEGAVGFSLFYTN